MEAKNLGDFVSIYQRFATAENKSPRTIEAVTAAVQRFDEFLGGCDDIAQATADSLRSYILDLQTRPRWANHPTIRADHGCLSPEAIASYVRSIRAFWSWLCHEGFLDENPLGSVKPPEPPRTLAHILTEEQVAGILAVIPRNTSAGARDFAALFTLYGTGLRVSELTSARLEDVDFGSGQIRVMGKGAKERHVYMSPRVFKVLLKYRERWRRKVESKHFFVVGDGRPLTRFHLAHRMQQYGRQAGVEGKRCSPKTLRSTFAVHYLRQGGDEFTLQRILGHSTLEMTRRYAELADGDVEAKMKAFSPAETLRIRV